MPRISRLTYPGGFYHIFNRGLNNNLIFNTEKDYEKLFDKLSLLVHEGDWIIYAYCLMPTHYHFLVQEKNDPIAKLMGRLFTSYSVYFNKKNKRQGPLFQDRFKSKLVQKDNYFLQVSRYIHLNPVKSHLVSKPEDYNYSSLKEYLGTSDRDIIDLNKVTVLLENNETDINNYLRFVKDGMNLDLDDFDPFRSSKEIIGSTVFSTHRKRG